MTLIHPKFSDQTAVFEGEFEKGVWKVGQVLKIGQIVNHKGECVDSLMLEPQGIAHLISEETISLPSDVCGLAHVLTRKCNHGLLTLGIGVIDPGWDSRISSPILNFSSERRLLQKGDEFIRVTFHRVQFEDGCKQRKTKPSPDAGAYLIDVRSRAVGSFGKNFLNIRQLVGRASKKENDRLRETMLKYLPIGAFSLAFFALLVTIGVATVVRMNGADDQDEVLNRLKVLEEEITQLGSSSDGQRDLVADPATGISEDPAVTNN